MDPLTIEDFRTLLSAIDTETTRIADRVAELVAKLGQNGLTSAEEAEVKSLLDAELTKLRAIGASTTPVPNPEPTPTPTPTPEPTPGEQP